MKQVGYLILGGSAAGTTAAQVIRSLDPQASIAVVTDETNGYYSRVLLPDYLSNKISREQVILKKPEWYLQNNIDLISPTRAIRLDGNKKEVTLANGEVVNFSQLLICVGGKTIKFNIQGADLQNVFYFKTLEDADKILAVSKTAKSAVVIGGGFIGLELLSSFKANKIENVSALIMEPYFWYGKLDEASSKVLMATLERNDVKIITGEETNYFEGNGAVSGVATKKGNKYDAQIVGIGIGIKSDTDWLAGSGLQMNRGIITDEYLKTNLPDVYAAGDCAEFKDVIFQRQHILGNWANAVS